MPLLVALALEVHILQVNHVLVALLVVIARQQRRHRHVPLVHLHLLCSTVLLERPRVTKPVL